MNRPQEHKKDNTHGKKRYGSFLHAGIAFCLVAYLIIALSISANVSHNRVCNGIRVDIVDTTDIKFIRPDDIIYELGSLITDAKGKKILDINTDSIECYLNTLDKIENSSVVRLTDGYILITVSPMKPVMRVFDGKDSYYLNSSGKRISAEARYHVDVPIVVGHFPDSSFSAIALLPLVEYISSDSLWNALITSIKVDSPSDIILIPNIKGHVINFGAPNNIANKFSRINRMYNNVMPVKGWEHYDTISVKWDSQVVATRRNKKIVNPLPVVEEDDESDNIETMLIDEEVTPG